MALNRKFSCLEENGIEFEWPTERIPRAEDSSYDPANTTLAATDVQAAITEVSAFHYSWRIIPAAKTVTIPYEQQMISYQEIVVEDTAELAINGEVVITL
jgi:hypothetical protein